MKEAKTVRKSFTFQDLLFLLREAGVLPAEDTMEDVHVYVLTEANVVGADPVEVVIKYVEAGPLVN